MIESVMYFGIGFLVAALFGLLFVPLVHNRAVRLTMKRLEASTPLSIAEIRADKDQLRAEFAMTTRRLEMSVDKLKAKTTNQLAELGKKTDAINQLKKELGEKTATIFALETRDKTLRDQLRGTEEEFQIKSGALREAERQLADKESELTKLLGDLGERSLMADSQRTEISALHAQVEAHKVSVADYERAVADTEHRLTRERADAETTGKELADARVSSVRIVSIGEPGPSRAEVRRVTSAATSLMRSRNSAFSTRSVAQVDSASRFIVPTSRCTLLRSSIAAASCASSWAISARKRSTAVFERLPVAASSPRRSASALRAASSSLRMRST